MSAVTKQLEIEKGAYLITLQISKCLLDETRGCIIGRNGTIELQSLLGWMKRGEIDPSLSFPLERNAGVFPRDPERLNEWAQEYFEANKMADTMAAGWYTPLAKHETDLFQTWNPSCSLVPLRALEPYYVKPELRWTKLLAGRRVAVVSSFTETMKKQLGKRQAIWGASAESLLPSTAEFQFFQTGYAPSLALGRAEWSPAAASWKEAVDRLESEILASGCRIVLIGCGGLGLPLAYRLRRVGKIVLVLGGAIQVLFGMKGKRWASHDVIGKFWNDAWAWPSDQETPMGATLIEDACYWGGKN